jgi:hypothetical protein
MYFSRGYRLLVRRTLGLVKKKKNDCTHIIILFFKEFIDDLFVYHGTDETAVDVIVDSIDSIISQIAPENTIKEDVDKTTNMKNLLRFFNPKIK